MLNYDKLLSFGTLKQRALMGSATIKQIVPDPINSNLVENQAY